MILSFVCLFGSIMCCLNAGCYNSAIHAVNVMLVHGILKSCSICPYFVLKFELMPL